MEMSHRQNYVIYLITLALAISILLGWLEFITNFKLEQAAFISVRNIVAIGMFYIVRQIYRHQVDYY